MFYFTAVADAIVAYAVFDAIILLFLFAAAPPITACTVFAASPVLHMLYLLK